ncbi:MAG TPA: hypothetical protein VLA97_17415 [Nocardioidaceae bacterium]|nr:hypothetical protein [Nocardioidaceae bacterium]
MRTIAVPTVLILLLAGCGQTPPEGAPDPAESPIPNGTTTGSTPETGSSMPAPETESPSATPRPHGTRIVTGASDFGTMLFDGTRQAIYLFDKETTSRPACYGACAEAWPPVLTDGEPRVGGETDASLLATTRRRDGSRQVTYAGHPLYYYAHEGRNQVLCHDVEEYGGVWLVVTPSGRPAD